MVLDRIRFDRMGVLELLRAAREPDEEYVKIGERLVSGAGDYLPTGQLELLVRDDMTAEVARREIQRQKAFVRRLEELLPSLLRHFRKSAKADVVRAVSLIDDCFHDFPIIKSGPRRDRAVRDGIAAIQHAEKIFGQAVSALAPLSRIGVDIDIDRFLNGYLEMRGDKSPSLDFDTFLERLRLLRDILKVCLVRAKTEDNYLLVSDNQAKTHVVDTAYTLSQGHDGPPLVTTPGSDFSIVCGLLYEIVAGRTNESLAGAINRFARSKERREADEHEQEEERREAIGDADNFFVVKKEATRAEKEAESYAALLKSSKHLDEAPRGLIVLMLGRAIEKANAARDKYGPHILWAHHALGNEEFRATIERSREQREQMKRLFIELGEKRRRKREGS